MDGQDNAKLADPTLLEAIDKLFELNIGDYVALPQLLVVGDQSSGKSSVLEGLTGIPYPRSSQLCTRFATQITFRRAKTTNFAVSLIPANNSPPEYAEKLRSWKKNDLKTFDSQTFEDILKDVYHVMEIGQAGSTFGDNTKTFSDDVLKIEICGPDQEHLSVIDVPGIFRKTTSGVTTKADMAMVRNMVTSYMQNPRSAMLTVIPANVDIGTQEILDMAEACDPEGQRTLGVLTKPDLVDEGAEHNVVDIVEGRAHPLKLGWCIVRNSGQQHLEEGSQSRHSREKTFFSIQAPWNRLPKDRVGVAALQCRLVEILTELIRREFPAVRSDINKRLKGCRNQLAGLGPHRDNKDQQYKFLLEIATRFQDITALALQARYGGNAVFDKSPLLRLATAIVERNDQFSQDLEKFGHARAFKKDALASDDEENGLGNLFKESEDREEHAENSISVRYCGDCGELDDVVQEVEKIAPPHMKGITNWIEEVYKKSRGYELGTFDISILPMIWREQSAKWDALSIGYISDIIALVHGFINELLRKTCSDDRIRRGLSAVLLDGLTERYKKGNEHIDFLLSVERGGTPLTTNHYFADNLEKCRKQRMEAQLKKAEFNPGTGDGPVVTVKEIMQSSTTSSNLEHIVCDLHDILKSYYKVARKRFVDNVCMQAADFHLVHGPNSPVRLFSPTFVSDLTEEQLEYIAGEDVSTKRKRTELEREIKSLESGRKLL